MNIKKQGLLYSVSAVLFMFAQWVISVVLVRLGGFDDAGVFSLAMSIANVFRAVAFYGLRNFQVSDVEHQFTQKQYFLSRAATVFISYLACILFLAFSKAYTPLERGAIFCYLIYVNTNAISDVLHGALQLRDKLYVNTVSYLLKSTLCGAGMLAAYAWRKDLVFALVVMALISILVTVVYDWREYQKAERLTLSVSTADMTAAKGLLKKGLPLMVAMLLPFAITAYPRQVIFDVLGKTKLGYFSSLFTPTVVITTLIPAIVLTIVPRLANAYNQNDKKGFYHTLAGCYGCVLFLTLLAEIAAVFVGRFFVALLFGSEILPYYSLLYWSIFISGLNAMGSCGKNALISIGRIREPMFITMADLAILLGLTYPLVDRWGMMGAVTAWLIVYGLEAAMQMLLIGYYMRKAKK